jgi:hypothetical protein
MLRVKRERSLRFEKKDEGGADTIVVQFLGREIRN